MEELVYHENYRLEDNYWWFVARNKILLKIIQSKTNLSVNDTLMDVGSGTGGTAKLLSGFYNVVCLEPSPIAIEYCKKRGLKNIFKSTLSDFDANGWNIKAVTMFDVIEHIDDDIEIINQVHNLLPDNGYFIIAVPAYMWLWSKHDEYHMHKRRYTLKQLKKLLENKGFKISYATYFNTFLFLPALLSKFMKRFSKYAKDNPVDEVPNFINSIFKKIFSFESFFLRFLKFPFGLSIIIIAKK